MALKPLYIWAFMTSERQFITYRNREIFYEMTESLQAGFYGPDCVADYKKLAIFIVLKLNGAASVNLTIQRNKFRIAEPPFTPPV